MASSQPPSHTQVLVIGGGPGGSTAASALAREGFDVVLLEMAQFPRYHIGESLIPSVRHYLRFIGAEEKVINHGFARKPGSAIKFNQYMQEGYTDFTSPEASNAVWNVSRSEFDNLLLRHAEECGTHVFEGCRVLSIEFAKEGEHASTSSEMEVNEEPWPGRPVSATYMTTTGVKGEITFDRLVDASGRAGIMSTKYLKNRHYNTSLKNVAVWGYWRDVGMYGKGTDRENAPFFEALSDESGWAWFIPLSNGLTSVGVVMDQKQLGMRSRACSSAASSTHGSSTPIRTGVGSFATNATTGLPTPTSGSRLRASSSAGTLHRGAPGSPSPATRSTIRARASSASIPGSSFVLPTTLELEKEIEKEREVDPDRLSRMPGDFSAPAPSSTSAYPSPPLTPLLTSFGFTTASSPPTPTSPTLSRPLMRLRSPSTTGEEIPPRKASALAERYLTFIQLAPGVMELIGDHGELVRVDEEGKREDVDKESTQNEGDDSDRRDSNSTRSGEEPPTARSASDFSYSASKYAGNGYRIIGDAGAFIDPFFSSGIHLAMTGALSAAASICASLRGDCTETEAAEWCSRRIAVSYTRFLVVVLSAYKQIRAQSTKVLADIDDNNFDKAFRFFRPVIQGGGEMGVKLSEDEVQRALDFCVDLFSPTTPEQHNAVKNKLSRMQVMDDTDSEAQKAQGGSQEEQEQERPMESWMDVRAPVISPSNLARMLRTRLRSFSGSSYPSSPLPSPSLSSSNATIPLPSLLSSSATDIPSHLDRVTEEGGHPPPPDEVGDSEMKMVLEKVNARRVIHADHAEGLNSLEQEDVVGFVVRLVRGQLGLVRVV